MYYNKQKRFKYLEDIINISTKPRTQDLKWPDWVKSPFLNYLNLIDYELKNESSDVIPWNSPLSQPEILQYCKKSIFSEYKAFLRNEVTQCDQNILPTLIRKVLYVFRLFNVSVVEGSFLYYYLVNSLFIKDCEDPALLLELWRTLCISNSTRIEVLSRVIDNNRDNKAAELLNYVVKAAYTVRFNFWGAWTDGQLVGDYSYCPVTAALLTGCFEQLVTLLQYGFQPNQQRLHTYDNHLRIRFRGIYDWLRTPLTEDIPKRRKTITEVLLFLVALSSAGEKKCPRMFECFKLVWSVMPTPIVTLQELRNEVNLRFCHPPAWSSIRNFPSTENNFLYLCDYYASVMIHDEKITVLEPRPLQHLCKCVIRSQLQRSWNLPSGIELLNLPKAIASYLQVKADLEKT